MLHDALFFSLSRFFVFFFFFLEVWWFGYKESKTPTYPNSVIPLTEVNAVMFMSQDLQSSLPVENVIDPKKRTIT